MDKSRRRERLKGELLGPILLIVFSPFILILFVFVILPMWSFTIVRRLLLGLAVQDHWHPKGKYALFVYSDNPTWKDYIETNILPRIADNTVVMNWSKRHEWDWDRKPLELRLYLAWTAVSRYPGKGYLKHGASEYNPLAIVFVPWWKPKVLKFWKPFKDYKHGKETLLKQVEEELFDTLAKAGTKSG